MKVEGEHLESMRALLTEIRNLLDAQGRRIQPDILPWAFRVGASGNNMVIPPIAGNRIFVLSLLAAAQGTVTATWGQTRTGQASTGDFVPFGGVQTGTSGNPGELHMADVTPLAIAETYPAFLFRTDSGNGLALNLSTNIVVGGFLTYWVA
jgi:hypothetical protein